MYVFMPSKEQVDNLQVQLSVIISNWRGDDILFNLKECRFEETDFFFDPEEYCTISILNTRSVEDRVYIDDKSNLDRGKFRSMALNKVANHIGKAHAETLEEDLNLQELRDYLQDKADECFKHGLHILSSAELEKKAAEKRSK